MTTNMAPWARRIRRERDLRGWTQKECVRRLRFQTTRVLPEEEILLRQWKRWEGGQNLPSADYQKLIAGLFNSVSGALFAAPRDPRQVLSNAVEDPDTTDLLSRLQRSSVDTASLEALRLTADRLCSDYPFVSAHQLLVESRGWLARVGDMLESRVTLAQHRELLSIGGLLALLVGCLEMDTGAGTHAEATRKSALTLGTEADDLSVVGWAYEMTAWFSLTRGDYRSVLSATEAGIAAAGERSVSVQLHAQEAKAWARVGDRARVEVALDRGRQLLEVLPTPTDVNHHFQVDPQKYDFYAMDTARLVGQDRMADGLADEVITSSTDWTGRVVAPMRVSEALITKGVVAARAGDLDAAVGYGRQALNGDRQSIPSLVMVSRELGELLSDQYGNEQETQEYIEELRALTV